ncbi:MAG: TerD family protein [Gracilibacteraceae bacterium]|jgi:stress response protein SCP2|nr:TerD family protein [Gracilibacteraceae bacterium]
MAISLQKGQKIDLSKNGSQLTNLMVGLGWKEVGGGGGGGLLGIFKQKVDVDIDASVVLLEENGKLASIDDLIYFGNKDHNSGSVRHCGDNLVGGTKGGMEDSEQILIDLAKTPARIGRLVFVVNIYDCVKRKQHFGMVENAYIRIVDKTANEDIASYNLTEDYSGKTAMVVGEIYRQNGQWKFNAIGEANYDPGLQQLIERYK